MPVRRPWIIAGTLATVTIADLAAKGLVPDATLPSAVATATEIVTLWP